MPVRLNSSGGGSVTLDVPSTAGTFTATVPANSGTLVTTGSTAAVTPAMLSTGAPSWDSSGNLSFNSGFGSAGVAYGCRAWVNFNGTGTVAIRASGNVSSITDTNVGRYTVNFTNAMPDANYCVALGGDNITGVGNAVLNTDGTYSTSGISISLTDTTNTYRDDNFVNVAVFR